MSSTDERVRKVLNEALALNLSEEELNAVQRADGLLGLDSVALLEFVLGLEEEFGIVFDPESLDPEVFSDLDGLVRHIDAVQKAAG